jgi:hypothetical protein
MRTGTIAVLVVGGLLVAIGVLGLLSALGNGGGNAGIYAAVIATGVVLELGAVTRHVIKLLPRASRGADQAAGD